MLIEGRVCRDRNPEASKGPREEVGFDKFEYVFGMLIEQGATVYGKPLNYEDHIQPLVNQFHEFDNNGSGSLDEDDLIDAIATKRAEAKRPSARLGA